MSIATKRHRRRKRRRIFQSSSSDEDDDDQTTPPPLSSSSSSTTTAINQLTSDDDLSGDDYLLVEVLCRLPSFQSLAQCKSVCKTWHRVISSHYFARRFISRHINKINVDGGGDHTGNALVNRGYHNNPYDMIFCYSTREKHAYTAPTYRHQHNYLLFNPIFEKLGFDFSFLSPGRKKKKEEGEFDILATCNDLFLCAHRSTEVMSFPERPGYDDMYLCNPFTKQWVALPRAKQSALRHALVCEPHCVKDGRGGYDLNYQYRYRVVAHMDEFPTKPWLDIYSSETGRWSKLKLTDILDADRVHCCSNIVAWNGKVHWFNRKDVIAFDPFDIQNHPLCFIKGPDVPTHFRSTYRLTVCRGFLRLMEIHSSASTVMVWELKDSKPGNWRLENKIKLELESVPYGLTCHPSDPNVIYYPKDNDCYHLSNKSK
ncbi:hypothetical protein Tsubulata_038881 [Turnera subulata]|uniref:F-box domain-containing protein n=1 Tax=Turnera subulata TaxID=218843 RepID=A0A9Q0F8D3_9ROSI|nr:hypothetical protein Tsubulata_038881 [Turnera subulata]